MDRDDAVSELHEEIDSLREKLRVAIARAEAAEILVSTTALLLGEGDSLAPEALAVRVIEEVCKREGYTGRQNEPLATWIIRCARRAETAEWEREELKVELSNVRVLLESKHPLRSCGLGHVLDDLDSTQIELEKQIAENATLRTELDRLKALVEPFRDSEGNPDAYADLQNTEFRDELIVELRHFVGRDIDRFVLSREQAMLIIGALRTANHLSGLRSSAAVDAEKDGEK
jgi:hypothetical protein